MRKAQPSLILLVAAIAVYANSLSGPLVLDDQATIVDNPQIRALWSADVLRPERELPVAGRPLANVTFAMNYAIGGTTPLGYRLVNLALHTLCALLVMLLMQQMLELPGMRGAFGGQATAIPLVLALLWLLHPLNSEVVNYLTQRTEALMALFYLLTLYAGLRALERGREGQWQALAVAACAAGALCKESIVTAPLLVVLLDRTFVFDSWSQAWRSRRRLYAGLFATWALLAAMLSSGPRMRSAGFNAGVDTWTYLLNQTVMISRYLWLAIWPRPLVVNYGMPQPLTLAAVAPYAALVLALLIATLVAIRYRPKWGFAGLWFFLMLAPTSSIVPIATEVGAERRMYLALLPILIAVIKGIWSVSQSTRIRFGLVAAIALLLGSGTFARNREYASSLHLAEVTVARWPTGVSRHMLGEQLLAAGRTDEAVAELREAIKDAPRAHYTLGMAFYNQGKLDEAIGELREFVRLEPLLLEVPGVQVTLARAYARQGRWDDAAAQAQEAVAKAPANIDARGALAEALFRAERVPEATAAYFDYVGRRPTDVNALTNLAILLISSGRTADALTIFRRAVDADPSNGQSRRNLATALLDADLIDEAVIEARKAADLRPGDAVARDLLSQALARQKR